MVVRLACSLNIDFYFNKKLGLVMSAVKEQAIPQWFTGVKHVTETALYTVVEVGLFADIHQNENSIFFLKGKAWNRRCFH